MAPTPLTLTELQTQQALAEGYQNGPLPVLNTVNINTQAANGNAIVPPIPLTVPIPDFIAAITTPNLNLSIQDLSPTSQNNMYLIDSFVGSSVSQIGEGGWQPYTVPGSIQDHALGFCGYAGSSSTYTSGAISYARFFNPAPQSLSYVNGYITDGAAPAAGFTSALGKYAIYSANGQQLLCETEFPVGLSNTGVFSTLWVNAPLFLPQGEYVLAWAAVGEAVPGTAKLEAIDVGHYTVMVNATASNIGTSSNLVSPIGPGFTFPSSLGTLTTNNNITLLPFLFFEL